MVLNCIALLTLPDKRGNKDARMHMCRHVPDHRIAMGYYAEKSSDAQRIRKLQDPKN